VRCEERAGGKEKEEKPRAADFENSLVTTEQTKSIDCFVKQLRIDSCLECLQKVTQYHSIGSIIQSKLTDDARHLFIAYLFVQCLGLDTAVYM